MLEPTNVYGKASAWPLSSPGNANDSLWPGHCKCLLMLTHDISALGWFLFGKAINRQILSFSEVPENSIEIS